VLSFSLLILWTDKKMILIDALPGSMFLLFLFSFLLIQLWQAGATWKLLIELKK
jgi:hypothetical protein